MKSIDFENFDKRKRAAFINSLSGFKSANLIGTISTDSKTNVSIVSSVFHLGADPALIGFIIRPDTVERDTLRNIRENKFCTLNHVNSEIWKKAHQTSARYPSDISEFDECSLTSQYLDDFKAPFVKESKLKMSLELVREVPIIENGTHMLILNIKNVYTDENHISESGYLDIEALDTITVSGLDSYHQTKRMARLSYAKPGIEVEEIEK
jgi:flavin reductase (DIM6/NTAB) family NADH-FMN oxidoreductase RutF